MTNPVLFITSFVMTVPHFFAVCFYGGPAVLQVLYLLGPCTSVLNHGTTSPWTLWLDRTVMTAGCLIDIWYARQLPLQQSLTVLAFTVLAVVLYACAKLSVEYYHVSYGIVFHVASHVCVSVSHVAMLFYYSKMTEVYYSLKSSLLLHHRHLLTPLTPCQNEAVTQALP